MSMILMEDVTFGYEGSAEPVFEHLNLQLDTRWRLGLTGRNGRGKTTLLRLLAGELRGQGHIIRQQDCLLFPYPVPNPTLSPRVLAASMLPDCPEWALEREFSLLEVQPEGLDRPFQTLSPGEQVKILLGLLFLRESGYLLIDEPTNHLDHKGRAAVATYLSRKQGFLLVSHDKTFLDRCTNYTLALNKTGPQLQRGSFSVWWENKQQQDALELAQNQRLKGEINRLTTAARQAAQWSDKVEATKKGTRSAGLRPDRGYLGHKAAKMMQRSQSIAQRRNDAADQKTLLLKDIEQSEALKLQPLPFHAHLLAEARALTLYYQDRAVCGPLHFSIRAGDRIALQGKNGCGKSTLIKLFLGENIQHTGQLFLPQGLILSAVAQTAAGLSGTPAQLAKTHGIDETQLLTLLRKLDFPRALFDRDMSSYSAGQKKKVLLAQSLCTPAHLFIWDEPLNFIDIFSRMQLQALLEDCKPTLLFVEHDQAFTQAIATKTLLLSD